MRAKIVFLSVFFLLWSGFFLQGTAAQDLAGWLDYTQARAAVLCFFVGEEEQILLEGGFSLNYPHSFSVSYETAEGWRRLVSYNDLVQLAGSGRNSYSQGEYWLFCLYRDYVYALAEFYRLPLKFMAEENLANREVHRYVDSENPENVYWIDVQTRLPLLVRQGEKVVVSVANYTFDSDFPEHYIFLELNVSLGEYPGKVSFFYTGEHWVPERLEVQEKEGRRIVEFSQWEVGADETGDLSNLEKLSVLIAEAAAEAEREDWEALLQTTQKAISLDSQYWQGFFYRGYAYGQLGNYLGAVENYQQALMLMPQHPIILNNLAYTYFLREVNLNQGIAMAEEAVRAERKPTNLDTLGYGYYLVGRYEEAQQLLEEALAAAKEEEWAAIEEHLFLVGEALRQKQDNCANPR